MSAKRRFRVWKSRRAAGRTPAQWRWECTLCVPPSRGARNGDGAWGKIISVSLPHHMRVRYSHHQLVARYES